MITVTREAPQLVAKRFMVPLTFMFSVGVVIRLNFAYVITYNPRKRGGAVVTAEALEDEDTGADLWRWVDGNVSLPDALPDIIEYLFDNKNPVLKKIPQTEVDLFARFLEEEIMRTGCSLTTQES